MYIVKDMIRILVAVAAGYGLGRVICWGVTELLSRRSFRIMRRGWRRHKKEPEASVEPFDIESDESES